MKTRIKKSVFFSAWALALVLVIAACSTDKLDEITPYSEKSVERLLADDDDVDLKSGSSLQNRILAEIRRATAKYQRFEAAVADGFMLMPGCVEHPEFGAMGYHAVKRDRIVPFVVPAEPPVLVYELTSNGRYRLVAAEYIVPAGPWDASNDGPPMLGEVEFDDHREMKEIINEAGEIELVNAKGGPAFPHYQLHVWVWKNNPLGMYFPFNPNVTCN